MDIVIDRAVGVACVELAVRGRLDAESAGELRMAVGVEVRRGHHAITLDLTGVTFLSSAGIRVLFETQREARRSGGDCLVVHASDPVRKVLELTRLDTILMRPAAANEAVRDVPIIEPVGRSIDLGPVRLTECVPTTGRPLPGRCIGSAATLAAAVGKVERLRLSSVSFAIGLASLAGDGGAPESAGESLAVCGSVFHRPPRSMAAVDYVLGAGDLVPEVDVVTGIGWEGIPAGHARYEPGDSALAIGIDELAAALLAQVSSGQLAVVMVGEVQGMIAAELIRPLAKITPSDHPLMGTREGAARWVCFSREPIHAGRTAIVVGVISREADGPLANMLSPLGRGDVFGHLHAVIFPHHPLRHGAGNLRDMVADLMSSEPVAVVHLMADDRPVLGSGVSEFIRGACWFAPLAFSEEQP